MNADNKELIMNEKTIEEDTDKEDVKKKKVPMLTSGETLSNMIPDMYSTLRTDANLFKEKVSPFTYYNGMYYVRTRHRDCSQQELKRLIAGGWFTKAHGLVLEALREFTYLNAFMIRTRLAFISGDTCCIDAVKTRKLLKSMVDKGFIQQYEFFHIDSKKAKQGSPFIYALTGGGRKYLKRQGFFDAEIVETLFSIPDVLYKLAFNQFHILFEKQYAEVDTISRSNIYGDSYRVAAIPGAYLLRLPDHSLLDFYVLPIRDIPGWSVSFMSSLRLLRSYAVSKKQERYLILAICTTEHQVMECHRYKELDSTTSKMSIFYTTDASIVTSPDVLDRLIEVEDGGNFGNRTIFSLHLRP